MTEHKPNGTGETVAPTRASASAAAARRARRIGGRPIATAAGVAPESAASHEAFEDVASAATAAAAEAAERGFREFPPAPAREADAPPAGALPAGAPSAPPAWLNWLPAAVLGAGAVAMAVLLIVFSHGVWWGPSAGAVPSNKTAALREQVLAAAKTCVATTNTYKYTELDTYEKDALACTTGQFTSQLRDTIDRLIKVNAPKLKSSQTAQINRGGIEAISPSGRQWTILLFGQLSVTNSNGKQPRTDPFGAQVVMQRVGTKWLMAKLTTVSTPLS